MSKRKRSMKEKRTECLTLRLTPSEMKLLRAIAHADDRTPAAQARRYITAALDDESLDDDGDE